MGRQGKNENAPVRRVTELMPSVSIIPSTGSWSGDNQLGNEMPFSPDSTNRQSILKLDEWGPPEVWTISLFKREPSFPFVATPVQAEINFGAGGTTQTILVDWDDGVQLSLPMNAVGVIAQQGNIVLGVPGTEGPSVRLGVQLARGRRGGSTPPICTMASEAEIASIGGRLVLPIPAFAQRVFIVPVFESDIPLVYSANFVASGNIASDGSNHNVMTTLGNTNPTPKGIEIPILQTMRSILLKNNGGTNVTVGVYAELFG